MHQLKGLSALPRIARYLLRWLLLVIPLSLAVGSLVAFFLWLLDVATQMRYAHEWLIYFLPVAGVAIYFFYKLWGRNAERGNNLIIDEIHEPGGGVPAGMAPLVLFATIITHLFGGSAGREGTAVQMGGSIAGFLGRLFRLEQADLRVMLMAGIAAGFGAVFGTPVAGTFFALEVLTIGAMRYEGILPCFMAAMLANIVTLAWGIQHTHYHLTSVSAQSGFSCFLHVDVILLGKSALAGVAFGLVARLFVQLSHKLKSGIKKLMPIEWLVPAAGGLAIISLCYALGTTDYLGLGVAGKNVYSISIIHAFQAGGVTRFSWFWKLLFTAITLSTGFKGGEVTPLFFIGAALGNIIAIAIGAPVDVFAALGFIAVFAGAANTPLACTIMGIELFGSEYVLYFAVACFVAYYFSGHTGIYTAQRIGADKTNVRDINNATLPELYEQRRKKFIDLWKKK